MSAFWNAFAKPSHFRAQAGRWLPARSGKGELSVSVATAGCSMASGGGSFIVLPFKPPPQIRLCLNQNWPESSLKEMFCIPMKNNHGTIFLIILHKFLRKQMTPGSREPSGS